MFLVCQERDGDISSHHINNSQFIHLRVLFSYLFFFFFFSFWPESRAQWLAWWKNTIKSSTPYLTFSSNDEKYIFAVLLLLRLQLLLWSWGLDTRHRHRAAGCIIYIHVVLKFNLDFSLKHLCMHRLSQRINVNERRQTQANVMYFNGTMWMSHRSSNTTIRFLNPCVILWGECNVRSLRWQTKRNKIFVDEN